MDNRRRQPLKITARRNIFNNDHLFSLFGPLIRNKPDATGPEDIKECVRAFVEWSDDANLYRRGCSYLFAVKAKSPGQSAGIETLGGWLSFWNQPGPSRSVEGVIRFRDRPVASPPEPLRLDRVQERSGELPADIGANPDQLGPGPAYHARRAAASP